MPKPFSHVLIFISEHFPTTLPIELKISFWYFYIIINMSLNLRNLSRYIIIKTLESHV